MGRPKKSDAKHASKATNDDEAGSSNNQGHFFRSLTTTVASMFHYLKDYPDKLMHHLWIVVGIQCWMAIGIEGHWSVMMPLGGFSPMQRSQQSKSQLKESVSSFFITAHPSSIELP
ncbi:hypothetical protein PIB30_097639 [Stylosanthes scabra]|uniref:Uncharacterized protein n=1 Tax=Stylosanthes scabra TaxID=79078 RepID=A0ABU6SWN9_9FABA|nr:hypothetical protein [Stylosanthes scabra]